MKSVFGEAVGAQWGWYGGEGGVIGAREPWGVK